MPALALRTTDKPYIQLYKDKILYETIKDLRLDRFDAGGRFYSVSIDGETYYAIPYGFSSPYDHTDKSVEQMILSGRFQ